MKKLYMIVLFLLVAAFVLSSCNIWDDTQSEDTTTEMITSDTEDRTDVAPISDETGQSEETSEGTEETTSIPLENIDRSFEKIASYPNFSMTESKRFVLFDFRGTICYYDKESGEVGQYCFDEDCEHKNWKECVSLQFLMQDKNQSVIYCEADHRFYSLRGQKLCSFSHEGEDVRIEYSFGESGDFDEFLYDSWSVYDLKVNDHYLYMIVCDAETQKKDLYRYDVITKEMVCLSEELYGDIEAYLVYGDKIYFNYYYKDKTTFCHGTLEMKRLWMFWGITNVDPIGKGIVWGDRSYYAVILRDSICFSALEFKDRKSFPIGEFDTTNPTEILAVDDENIYFVEHKQYPSYSNIYALNIETGETKLVFNGASAFKNKFRLENMRFLPDDQVLLTGMVGGSSVVCIADIDENGSFVNAKVIFR